MIEQKTLSNTIKALLIKANTVLDKSVFECIEKNSTPCVIEEMGVQCHCEECDSTTRQSTYTQNKVCKFGLPRSHAFVRNDMESVGRVVKHDKYLDFHADKLTNNDIEFILQNAYLAKKNNRPLCQDTGQVLVFLKLPYSFSFGYDFKKVINDAVEKTYEEEFYRKSVVKNSVFDRDNTGTNTPAIIYTDFENRESVKIDVLIKGGGAENMSFVEMFNPTTSQEEIISFLSQKINERAKNACPPLFIGIGAGGTMDYAAILSKKALFEGIENEFCKKVKECCNKNNITSPLTPLLNEESGTEIITCHCERSEAIQENFKILLSVKMLSSSTHIASLPVAVTINCHSNRHSGCEIGKNGVIFNDVEYEISPVNIDLSNYKKINTNNIEEIKKLKSGDKILLSGTIYAMRDAAHKKVFELIEKGLKLPFEIKNSAIFYAGPAPKKEGEVIGPIGPTTAKRMDKFAPKLYDLGCILTIGKGERSNEVKDACKRNDAHYLSAFGGIACYLQKSFKKSELVAFEELGTEAIRRFEIEDLPLTVEF